MKTCDRCKKPTSTFKMSIFNTEMICMECLKEEEAHPLYHHAKAIELGECRKGNLNFEGIGLPVDLQKNK